MIIEFKSLNFKDWGEKVEIILLDTFSTTVSKKDLSEIGKVKIAKNSIEFTGVDEKTANRRFNMILLKGFSNLKNKINNKPAVYVHRNSGIPLIGSLSFGIVDKGSNMIEIKPITSCELNCIFCSVGEGLTNNKQVDFVVEEEYLIEELNKLLEFKQQKDMQAYINPHGEPLLYADIAKLIKDIKDLHCVDRVAMMTNGNLLTEKKVDELANAGLDQINLSLNAVSPEMANKLAGTAKYNVEHVRKMVDYMCRKIEVVLAPVWLDGVNDEDIEKIIELGSEKKCKIGIQKFCENKRGRNPAKEVSWDEFFDKLKDLEKKHDVELIEECKAVKTNELPKPFTKGDVVKAQVVCNGRNKNEKLAVANDRVISIPGCFKDGNVKVKIVQDKHNVFIGKLV